MKYDEWAKLRNRALAIAGPEAFTLWRIEVKKLREMMMADPNRKDGYTDERTIAWQIRIMESNPLLLEGLMLARLEGE